jgi:hypothetical protein
MKRAEFEIACKAPSTLCIVVRSGLKRAASGMLWFAIAIASVATGSHAVAAQDTSSPGATEQNQTSKTFLNQSATEEEVREAAAPHYNIRWGSGGFNFNAGLKFVYVDNVFLTYADPQNDFVLVPNCDITAFFPIGHSNTLALNVGIDFYHYFKNTELNSAAPLINPGSEIAFNLQTGDFTFRFSDQFSYQVSPVYENGAEYYNLYNTGEFARFLNIGGVAMKWDLNHLVVTAGFHNEALFANGSTYSYVDHVSELFDAGVMLNLTPVITAGLETAGSLNNFVNNTYYNTWRVRGGPAVQLNLSQFVQARMGGGYERIQYDSSSAAAYGLTYENTYYAYAGVEQQINRFFSHTLRGWHDNQLGFNAANLEGTHILYSLTWKPNPKLTLSGIAVYNWYVESFGSNTANLYDETYTFFSPGVQANYQFDPHWLATLRWDYRNKDSDIQVNGYVQNLASIQIVYQF